MRFWCGLAVGQRAFRKSTQPLRYFQTPRYNSNGGSVTSRTMYAYVVYTRMYVKRVDESPAEEFCNTPRSSSANDIHVYLMVHQVVD